MDGKRSRGRAGFLKGKLMWSLYRASATHKLPATSSTTKVKPNNPTADQAGYMKMPQEHLRSGRPHQSYNNIPAGPPAHQLTQLPTQTRSVSYYHPTTDHDITNKTPIDSYSAAKMDYALYGGIAVDDEIDIKAANYISSVRERFRLA